jgi:hypothetical protein
MSPRLLYVERNKQREKILQVAAGYSHSIVMTDSRELFIFGTGGYVSNQSRPIILKLSDVLGEMFPETNILSNIVGAT